MSAPAKPSAAAATAAQPDSLHAQLVALQRELRPILGPIANATVELVLAEVASGVPLPIMRGFVRQMEQRDERDSDYTTC